MAANAILEAADLLCSQDVVVVCNLKDTGHKPRRIQQLEVVT